MSHDTGLHQRIAVLVEDDIDHKAHAVAWPEVLTRPFRQFRELADQLCRTDHTFLTRPYRTVGIARQSIRTRIDRGTMLPRKSR